MDDARCPGSLHPFPPRDRAATNRVAWEGSCTGSTWNDLRAGDLSCWLVGSGAYKGLTYYMHARTVDLSVAVDGVILPAPPPTTR